MFNCKYCKKQIPDYEHYSLDGTCCKRRWWDRQANIDRLIKEEKSAEKRELKDEMESEAQKAVDNWWKESDD